MRAVAREEAAAVLAGSDASPLDQPDRVASLEKTVAELRERLDNLESDVRDMAHARARRTPRKTTGPTESGE
jgi:cell division protein FtsB